MIGEWINKNRIIRRVLIASITVVFLKCTLHIFNNTVLDTSKVAAYGMFCGLETLILKFYLQGKNDEINGD